MTGLGSRLRYARTMAGLTQGRLALLLSVNRVSITQWEADIHEPSVTKLRALCEVLKVDPAWLLGLKK